MLMTILIRKHTFTEELNSYYFGNYATLLEAELSDPAMEKLFNFFETVQHLKQIGRATTTRDDGTGLKFHKSSEPSLYGYTSMGFSSEKYFVDRIQSLTEHADMMTNLNDLYNEIGWTISNYKTVEVDIGDYDPVTDEYSLYPKTFEEIEHLWSISK